MENHLVIVESPAKAKTISKYLGKEFVVKSSYGHIRDLSKKNLGISIEDDFRPSYEIASGKQKVVSELRADVKNADMVWLASDEDREGEAIAWHLAEVLKLKKNTTKRIVFHEITKDAIQNAVKNPRGIDYNLVDAQQARRILDRLVGFQISPVLWKKVQPSLSAGRVQSVAVRLIVEREREILNFEPKDWYKVVAHFDVPDKNGKTTRVKADLNKRFAKKDETSAFLETCKNQAYTVASLTRKPTKKSPAPPFTTSTLQQEAGRKLSFSVSQTMTVAQRLYEAGLITYMRTDSVNLSNDAMNAAQQQIIARHGDRYAKRRQYRTKTQGAQEAHEAIRPSYMERPTIDGPQDQKKLYELIWKRTIASQMANAELERTTAEIAVSGSKLRFVAQGEIVKFDGFLKVYLESSDDENAKDPLQSKLLPPLQEGQTLDLDHIEARQKFSAHPPRYNEATLVKKLEELGIGRPSTYAPTISTVQQRGYIIRETRPGFQRKFQYLMLKKNKLSHKELTENYGSEKQKLFPTNTGMVVNDFLLQYFDGIFDYNFTAEVEKEFDRIAEGKLDWTKMLKDFYSSFHPQVEKTLQTSSREFSDRHLGTDPTTGKEVIVRIGRFGPMVQLGGADDTNKQYASLRKEQLLEKITLDEALELLKKSNQGRKLGTDPNTGKDVIVRIAKYGPIAQLGSQDDEEKPQYVGLLKGQDVDTITLEEALELFKLPRTLGQFEGKDVVASRGRFGPYIRHDSKFVSLKKGDDPFDITLARAEELIKEKRKRDADRLIKTFEGEADIKVVKDRWGKPCVQYKRKFIRIPTQTDPQSLSLDDCKKMLDEKGALPATKSGKKSSTKKTSSTKSKKSPTGGKSGKSSSSSKGKKKT